MISRKKIILKSEEMQKENIIKNINNNKKCENKTNDVNNINRFCDLLFPDEADLYDENVWFSLEQLLSVSKKILDIVINCNSNYITY